MVAIWMKVMVVMVMMRRRRWRLIVEIIRWATIESNRMEHILVIRLWLGIRHDKSRRLTMSMNKPLRLWRVWVGKIRHCLSIRHILLRVHALLRLGTHFWHSRMPKKLWRAFTIRTTHVDIFAQSLTDQIYLIGEKLLLLSQIVKVDLIWLIGGKLAHVRRLLTIVSLLIVARRGGHKHIVHLIDVVVFVLVVLLGLDAWVVGDVNFGVIGVKGVLNACLRFTAWKFSLLLNGIEHFAWLIVRYFIRMIELMFGTSNML